MEHADEPNSPCSLTLWIKLELEKPSIYISLPTGEQECTRIKIVHQLVATWQRMQYFVRMLWCLPSAKKRTIYNPNGTEYDHSQFIITCWLQFPFANFCMHRGRTCKWYLICIHQSTRLELSTHHFGIHRLEDPLHTAGLASYFGWRNFTKARLNSKCIPLGFL